MFSFQPVTTPPNTPGSSSRARTLLLTGLLLALSASGRAQQLTATQQLTTWNAEFRRDIVEVAPAVYTAIGYGGSTLSMVVGVDGVVIVDAGSSIAESADALDAFRKISQLPIRAIIYTHGHRDHNLGSPVFEESGAPAPEVWAHAQFGVELSTLQQAGLTINRVRADRQFGAALPPAQRINNGIGPANPTPRTGPMPPARPPLPPTRFVTGRAQLTIAGVAFELVANPGETDDELYVWLPDRKVLFAGDNFYRCLPNLYAIRGTPYRDVRQWANAIDQLLSKSADALVGGHTRPVVGNAAVLEALTDYRDTIRYIFDKTIEGMNRGLTPDELLDYVQLPPRLAAKPYLLPYYGRTEWAVRSIFSGYLGWFDGNATTLFPLSSREKARRIATLAGGSSRILDAARAAVSAGDFQWAAELTDHLLALDPGAADVKALKAQALEALAANMVTATARNYYLSAAQELRADISKKP
jgi:alkyl sulfatase BDS1-like metallo-beta-lactamase superfamily hydrolase